MSAYRLERERWQRIYIYISAIKPDSHAKITSRPKSREYDSKGGNRKKDI